MNKIHIHNWDRWQTYRKDRGVPPWIKLHRRLTTDAAWASLSDAQRGQLVAMWLTAAERDGELPACPKVLKKLCGLDCEPDLQVFIDAGFLDVDAKLAPTCQPHDAPETETETEEDREAKASLVVCDDDTTPQKSNGHTESETRKAFDNWNTVASELGLPTARKLTPDRERKLKVRLRQHGLKGWNEALRNLYSLPFCLGENKSGWKADFEFMLQAKSFTKVLEMAYAQAEGDRH